MQGLANGGGRPSLAGRRSGAWRRSMETEGAEAPVGEGSREPTVNEHPVDAELSASDFQVTVCRCRARRALLWMWNEAQPPGCV